MVKKIGFSFFIFFVSLEILLRLSGTYKSYGEKSFGKYIPQYRQSIPSWSIARQPNSLIKSSELEFEYLDQYNDYGHREKNSHSYLKDSTIENIICIGDSFTEGKGAPYDSSWVRKLEAMLNEKDSVGLYHLYNAGVSGSDVFFNNKILIPQLMALKPSVVIECVNYSDIYDVINRGGKERFNKDGTTTFKVGPKWEIFYEYSHVFRAFIRTVAGYNNDLIKERESKKLKLESLNLISEQISQTAEFCEKNEIKYMLIIHPTPNEIEFKSTTKNIILKLSEKIITINLFEPMFSFFENNDIANYSWKVDGHYNSKGYTVMGELIYQALLSRGGLSN